MTWETPARDTGSIKYQLAFRHSTIEYYFDLVCGAQDNGTDEADWDEAVLDLAALIAGSANFELSSELYSVTKGWGSGTHYLL